MVTSAKNMLKGLWPPVAAFIVAALLVALYSFLAASPRDMGQDQEREHLNSVMAHHDKAMSNWLSTIADTLANPSTHTFPQDLALANYSLYVFDNDSLRLWHNSCLPNPDPQYASLNQHILVAENGWFYVKSIKRGPTTLIALLRIRSHSPYDNDYIADTFHPSFGIGSEARISTTHADGVDVNTPDGSYLFTVTGNTAGELSPSLYYISACLLLITLFITLWGVVEVTSFLYNAIPCRWPALLICAALLTGLYFSSLLLSPPGGDDSSFFFSPLVFSYDWRLPSIGHLMLAATFLLTWCAMFFRLSKVRTRLRLATILAATLPTVIFLFAGIATELLARHSQGLAFYIGYTSMSADSLAKLVTISLLTMSIVLVMERCFSQVARQISVRTFMLMTLPMAIVISLIIDYADSQTPWFHGVAYFALCCAFYLMKRRSPYVFQFSHYVWTIMIMALVTTVHVTMLNVEKEMGNRKLLSVNLSFQLLRDDDPIAEQRLPLVQTILSNDTATILMMSKSNVRQDQLYGHLRNAIFSGYFTRYDLQVIPCRGNSSTIQMTNTGDVYDCSQYFEQLVYYHGVQLPSASQFYRIDNGDGRPCYLGKFSFGTQTSPNNLFVQITRKVSAQGVGYPEILTNKRDRMDDDRLRGYSYARYANSHLVSHYGPFDYPTTYTTNDTTQAVTESNGYSHIATTPQRNQTIVVSYPQMKAQNLLTTYSYIFLGMLIASSVIMIITIRPRKSIWTHSSLSERLHASLVAFVLVLFVILCLTSSIQSINTFETNSRSRLSEAMRSVLLSLSDEFADDSPADLTEDFHDFETDNILQRSAEAFSADAHLFSAAGHLVGTSRRELFMSGIASPLMNDEALSIMRSDCRGEVFVQEHIGSLLYYSIYSPLFNNRGEVIGYVNVPFFNDVSAMRRQMMQTLLPITNSMMLIILLAIVFSYAMAHGVTRSLGQLRDVLQAADLGATHKRLSYPYDDEVGEIVKAYNKMNRQLEASAERLAASERESTWREMARQVAHEIKNPLTPMKLSVQYLLRIWDTHRDNFEPMLKRTSKTLIEQIDQLAAVASQFSGVAKMKQAEPERMDLTNRLSSICTLFARSEESNLSYEGPSEGVFIMADPDLITSVFNNLIKNAQQSASDGRRVDIAVRLETDVHSVKVTVSDNGDGIDDKVREKIFRPNFTTKSTGMGLGLAITKTIVTNSGGTITFDSEMGSGTTFTVRLPRI